MALQLNSKVESGRVKWWAWGKGGGGRMVGWLWLSGVEKGKEVKARSEVWRWWNSECYTKEVKVIKLYITSYKVWGYYPNLKERPRVLMKWKEEEAGRGSRKRRRMTMMERKKKDNLEVSVIKRWKYIITLLRYSKRTSGSTRSTFMELCTYMPLHIYIHT